MQRRLRAFSALAAGSLPAILLAAATAGLAAPAEPPPNFVLILVDDK